MVDFRITWTLYPVSSWAPTRGAPTSLSTYFDNLTQVVRQSVGGVLMIDAYLK